MLSDIIRVGILGLGAMGQNHLRVLSILKNVDLAFVYDTNLSKAETLATAHNTTAVSTLAEAWKTPVDAVVICTPTSPMGVAGGVPVSEDLARRVFSLPMHPYLPEDQQDYIIDVVRKAVAA